MPEVSFRIRWPDGTVEECYSPSTAIREHLAAGESYPLAEFLRRSGEGLERAALRVEERYGFRCSSADAQRARIEARAAGYGEGTVTCLSIS